MFAQQGNLFGGFGDGRNIEVRLQSSDFDALLEAARKAQDVIIEKMPGAQVQSFQDLELSEPELRLVPGRPPHQRIGLDPRQRRDRGARARRRHLGRRALRRRAPPRHDPARAGLGQPGRARRRAGRDADRRRRAARRAGRHRADRQLDGPAPRGRAPHDRHQRRRAARHLAAAGHGEAARPRSTRRCGRCCRRTAASATRATRAASRPRSRTCASTSRSRSWCCSC